MSALIEREPRRLSHERIAQLERLLTGDPDKERVDALTDYVFNTYGFRRRKVLYSYDPWRVTNQAVLHLYRHSTRNRRQTHIRTVVCTRKCKPDRPRSGSRSAFVYSARSLSRKKREIISTGSSHGQSSDTSDVDSGLQGDVVQQKVKSLAQLVNEGQLGLEAVKPVLHEIAGTMISQIMQSSSVHMEEFLNVIRETTIPSESRTPISRVSTVVSGDDENVYSNFLDDDSALVLAAGFLADLTESVAMHLGDMLEDQLVNVVTVQDEEEEEVEQEREEVEQERKDGEEAIDETSKVPLS